MASNLVNGTEMTVTTAQMPQTPWLKYERMLAGASQNMTMKANLGHSSNPMAVWFQKHARLWSIVNIAKKRVIHSSQGKHQCILEVPGIPFLWTTLSRNPPGIEHHLQHQMGYIIDQSSFPDNIHIKHTCQQLHLWIFPSI
jgi:hypothetical protein